VEIAVDVVFNHCHASFCSQPGEPALVLVGHDAAERVAGVGHQQAGSDPAFASHQIEGLDRHAAARIGGYFERLEAEGLKQLQHQVVAGRFDGDRIARAGDGPQAEAEGLGAGIGDHQLVRRQRSGPAKGAQDQLADQCRFVHVDMAAGFEQPRMAARDTAVESL
jgi:hypothetical protein